MAVNYADGMTFAGVVVCPVYSAVHLVGTKAGWFTVPCVVAALPVCFAVLYVGRTLTYSITGVGFRLAERMHPWVQGVFFLPFFLLYFILPILGGLAAVLATSYTATFLAAFAGYLGGWAGFATVSIAAVLSVSAIVAFCKGWVRYAAKQHRERDHETCDE